MKIFRAFDIRGDYPSQLNKDIAYKIAQSYVKFLKPNTIVVGHDARDSSPEIYKSVINGLRSQSTNVIKIGFVTTPEFYYALKKHKKYDGGIMITSSHSPLNTNGLKLCSRGAESIHIENGLKIIEHYFRTDNFKNKNKGKIKKHKVLREYKEFILKNTKKLKLKIGLDCSNMSGVIDYKILKNICKIKAINTNTKAKKPYFEPNPLIEKNLNSLKELVKKKKLDLGIFFDGDCDRVKFVDEKGNSIEADIIGAFLADNLKNKIVLKDQQCSRIIKEVCKNNNNKCKKTRIGHSFVDTKMKRLKADLGIERSGHFYFKEFFYKDNALLAAIKVLNLLNEINKPYSEVIKQYKKYFHSGEINIKTKYKDEIIEKIKRKYSKQKISTYDGIKIEEKEYWIHIRKSKTQDLLRLNIEATTKDKLNKLKKELKDMTK